MSTSAMDEPSFMDQCRVVCLHYVKIQCERDTQALVNDAQNVVSCIEKEVEAFDFNTQNLISAAISLADKSKAVEGLDQISNVLEQIVQRTIDEKVFREYVSKIVSKIESWDHVALVLYLTFKLICKLDSAQLPEVLDACTRYLRSDVRVFIESHGGWVAAGSDMSSSGILSSIVMVDQSAEGMEMESGHFKRESPPSVLSPPDSPPFSLLPSNVDDERDSLNSATPPEMVERPPMTSSLLQMMGAGDAGDNGNAGASSDSSGFEMVAPGSKAQKLEQIGEPEAPASTEPAKMRESTKPLQASPRREPRSPIRDAPAGDGGVSDYIPHISVGVAAAAAAVCVGLFVMKRNT